MSADRDEWDYGPFKVGDVVEGYGFVFDTECNAMQAVIIEDIHPMNVFHRSYGYKELIAYTVEWNNGEISAGRPDRLRRRKSPMTGLQDVLSMFKAQPNHVKEVA